MIMSLARSDGESVVAPEPASSVAARLARVRDAIAGAARRVGRDPSSVALVVVTKGVAVERVEEAIRARTKLV